MRKASLIPEGALCMYVLEYLLYICLPLGCTATNYVKFSDYRALKMTSNALPIATQKGQMIMTVLTSQFWLSGQRFGC